MSLRIGGTSVDKFNILTTYRLTMTEYDRAFQHVLEFSNIAGSVVALQHGQGALREVLVRGPMLLT